MKVKLIRPFFSKEIYKLYKGLPKKREIRNPLGLMILANVLKDHKVEIIDGELEGLSNTEVAKLCINSDIVGITCTTPEFELASNLASEVKYFNPKCKVILGGAHSTVVPKECLEANKNIDFIVRFEGEETFPDLLDNLEYPERVKGIAYRNNNDIIITEDRPLIKDLDKYNADWLLVKPNRYFYPFPKEGLVPTANIAGTRGCPYKCRYCFRMFGNKVRLRKPVKIYLEMKFIKDKFGITHFFFTMNASV